MLCVPANTRSPVITGTGRDSPVSSAAFTCERPSTTVPSAAKLSPARTSSTMPGSSASVGTSRVTPSSTMRADTGASACNSSDASVARRCPRCCRNRPTSSAKMSSASPSKYTGPESVTVFTAPRMSPTANAMAMGRSMCNDRVRSDAHAPVKNTRPGHAKVGTISPKQIQRKKCVNCTSMPFNSPLYSANDASMTLMAMAPAIPIRTSIARSSRFRMSSRATPRKGCGGYPRLSNARATVDSGTADASHSSTASARRTCNSARTTPGTTMGMRSTSHTHDAQCTPSRYNSMRDNPSGCTRT